MPNRIEGKYHLESSPTLHLSHPELSALIMQSISTYAQIETRQGAMLNYLLSGSQSVGMAMYTAISGSSMKQRVLIRAARAAFRGDPEPLCIVETAVELSERTRRTRNKFAHSTWATYNDRKDCLALTDPTGALHWQADHREMMTSARRGVKDDSDRPDMNKIVETTLLYSRGDLEAVRSFAEDDLLITNNAGMFISAEDYPGVAPNWVKEHSFEELMKSPRFKEVFDKKFKKLTGK